MYEHKNFNNLQCGNGHTPKNAPWTILTIVLHSLSTASFPMHAQYSTSRKSSDSVLARSKKTTMYSYMLFAIVLHSLNNTVHDLLGGERSLSYSTIARKHSKRQGPRCRLRHQVVRALLCCCWREVRLNNKVKILIWYTAARRLNRCC